MLLTWGSPHQAWPKGIAGPAAATPWEATHAVLAGSEPVETEGHTSSLAIPPALQEVPNPTAARPPVQRLTTAQHGSVVTPIFDVPHKGGQPWVDGFVAFLFFGARSLQTGMRSQVWAAGKGCLRRASDALLCGGLPRIAGSPRA